MKIIKGDKIKVISGKNKGVESVVLRAYPKENKIVAENVNIVSRHVKKSRMSQGGIMKMEKVIDVSNVMIVCPNCKKETRVGFIITDGKKYRVCRKCNQVIKTKA